jgi:hypothetical protein
MGVFVGECGGGGGCAEDGERRGVAACGENRDEVSDSDRGGKRAYSLLPRLSLVSPVLKT